MIDLCGTRRVLETSLRVAIVLCNGPFEFQEVSVDLEPSEVDDLPLVKELRQI